MVNYANDKLDREPKDKGFKRDVLANIEFIDRLLGIGGEEPFRYFQMGVDERRRGEIEELIEIRAKAKRDRDYTEADRIRDILKGMGVSIMDTPSGTLWEV